MDKMFRCLSRAIYVVPLAVGVANPISVAAQSADSLNKARDCQVQTSRFFSANNATWTFAMANDGGWCWSQGYASPSSGRYLAASDLSVAEQPKHGRVTISDAKNHRIRVAYQSAAGFTGHDQFVVHYDIMNSNVTNVVTVAK